MSQVGRSVLRREDITLLQGLDFFIADFSHPLLEGLAHVVFVRSPFAHALIGSIDTSAAESARGVLAVVSAKDHEIFPVGSVFPEYFDPIFAMPIIAEGRVRYVGEPVVAVVAESAALALDAAELVVVDYEPLQAVIDLQDAASDQVLLFPVGGGARLQRPLTTDYAGTNTAMLHEHEHDPEPFGNADVAMKHRFVNPRQLPAPIEAYGQVSVWDEQGHLHVWAATQRPHGFRAQLAEHYRLEPATVHVHAAPAVGGGFGGKVSRTPEEHILPFLARVTGRPVRWLQTRSEYFMGATQGRGEEIEILLAGTADGRITALRTEVLKDSGAYPGVGGNLPGRFNSRGASGPYDIAHVEFFARSVVTNAPQVSAFRGAGRAPFLAALERMVDLFAVEVGLDPAEVRRRNLVRPDQMPFVSATGAVYDEADYPGDLETALARANYEELRLTQAELRSSGASRQLGIGISSYHLMTVGGGSEEARVQVHGNGDVTIFTGTTTQGHSHVETWGQIASDVLGVALEQISVKEGSTDYTATGVGAVGSRSLQTAGIAILHSSEALVEEGKRIAAALLEAAIEDIEFSSGGSSPVGFHVAGVPSWQVGWGAVADHLESTEKREMSCGEVHDVGENNSFPSGCHVAVVEVDIETGAVDLVSFHGVDDVGLRVNPMVVEGQLHGGIMSGIGQALGEVMQYDEDGNPLTTNFVDYGFPSIDLVPQFDLVASSTHSSFNDLGVKGVGESGGIGSMPAVHNAILDAVAHLGVRHIDIPCSPQRIWRAIASA